MFRTLQFAVIAVAGLVLSGCASDLIVKSKSGTTTTLIMLRHAERTTFGKILTDKGRARAAALPAALQGTHIDSIYSPNLSRNRNTVAPLAKQRGISVTILEPTWTSGYAARLIDKNPGKTVLWVGNFKNLNEIYADIGGQGDPPLSYGDLYIIRVPDKGPVRVTRSRYGR